jgi:hypothetical protein
MEHELDILPVMEDDSRPQYREVHPNILKPPFRMALIGSSKSGKSNLLMNLLRSDFYGGDKKKGIEPCFTRIVVLSPNLGMDSTTRSLSKLCNQGDIRTSYNDAFIYDLIESQKEKDITERDRIFLIIDDLLGLGCKLNSLLYNSVSYMRHLDISCCFITQTLKGQNSLPPSVRNNLDALIFFKNGSHKQVEALCDEFQGTFGNKQNVENMLYYATAKPYHFCFFNVRELKVFHNFTEFLWEKYNENGEYSPDFVNPNDVEIDDNF